MPEGTENAALLIAVSYQALNRTISGDPRTLITDCTVLILFAGFYIEATLDHIVDEMNVRPQMTAFLFKRYPGLQDKLAWFYNEYVARDRAANKDQLYAKCIKRKLRRKFPGFAKLYRFRNDVAHGKINRSAHSRREAHTLRDQAKAIAASLYEIGRRHGHDISRDVTYWEAITS